MAYTKTQWVDNTTPIDKDNLNKIEQGIYDNSLVVDAVTNTLNPTDTETYKTAELTEEQITDVIGVNDIVIKGQTLQDETPTPSAPVDVNVVSGSNVINTSNKNLLSLPNGTYSYNNVTAIVNKGIITINGTPSSTPTLLRISLTQPIKLKQNDSIKINGNNSNGIGTNSNYVAFRLAGTVNGVSNDNITDILCTNANANKTFTATNDTIINQAIIRGNTNVTFNNFIIKPQIELGTTTTTYEPHQGKELPLDLGTIELCKIGDYQDYYYKSGSKWYLHKEIGKIVLDGSENWSYSSPNSVFYTDVINTLAMYNSDIFCNRFKKVANSTSFANMNNGEIIVQSDNNVNARLVCKYTNYTLVADFKTWLASNNTNVYYPLKTLTDTEITNTTLISQLEAIYNAPLYEETNITQTNNDLPMILDITACKDNINGIKAFIRK